MNAPLHQSEPVGRLTLPGDPVSVTPPKRSAIPVVHRVQTTMVVANQHRSQRLADSGRFFDLAPKSGELTVVRGFKRDIGLGQGDHGSSHIETEGGFMVDAKKGVEPRAARGFAPDSQRDVDLQSAAKLSMSGVKSVCMDTSPIMALSAGQILMLSSGTALMIRYAEGSIVLDGTSISKLVAGAMWRKAKRIEVH